MSAADDLPSQSIASKTRNKKMPPLFPNLPLVLLNSAISIQCCENSLHGEP